MAKLPKPLPSQSQQARRWQQFKLRERMEVMRRSRGFCEGCGKQTWNLQGAHIFGRRNIIGEPFASSRYLVAALCYINLSNDSLGCHEKIDRHEDEELRERLEEEAARRLFKAFGWEIDPALSWQGNVRMLGDHATQDEIDMVFKTANKL